MSALPLSMHNQLVCSWEIRRLLLNDSLILTSTSVINRKRLKPFFPSFWLFVQPIAFDRPAKLFSAPSLMRALLLGLPVLIYVGFTLIYAQSIGLQLGNSQAAAERFAHFDLNFSHQPEAIETFLSIFLA